MISKNLDSGTLQAYKSILTDGEIEAAREIVKHLDGLQMTRAKWVLELCEKCVEAESVVTL